MIVLDTHALVWWVSEPARLPPKARRAVDAASETPASVAASSISIWEIAMLVRVGRLQLTVDAGTWIANVEALPFLRFVPVDNGIAARAVALEEYPHRDPADRMIIATALGLNAKLVTADRRMRSYRPLTTLWD